MKGMHNQLIATVYNETNTHFDLHIEHGLRVDRKTKGKLDVVCETLLVALLH